MRRVRYYLRTTMPAQRFSSLGLLYIERDLSRDIIKAHDVVAEYASYELS